MLTLKILQGPTHVGTAYNLEAGGSYVIGRADGVDVQLKSSGVSKSHCRLSVLPGNRIEVEDLGSANGTYVNGLQIKRHVLKPGDTLNIHSFAFKLFMKAPTNVVVMSNAIKPPMGGFDGNAALNLEAPPGIDLNAATARDPQSLGERVESWLASNIYPVADSMGSQFDLRYLIGIFFVIWSIFIITFTAFPFKSEANLRVETQALEVGRLYARQLVRVNSQAIIEQRFRDLIGTLDSMQGQTKNVIATYIIDTQKQQILAPARDLGKAITNAYVQRAIQSFAESASPYSEYAAKGDDGIGYVAVPIMVGTPEGNKTVAMGFVMINIGASKFTIAALFDQIVSSLLYSLLASLLFLILVYRWMDGSLAMMTERVDAAMKRGEASVASPVEWPAMRGLAEQISFALGKNVKGAEETVAQGTDWARASVEANLLPAACFDTEFVVQYWNSKLELLTGQSGAQTAGQELSRVWRDTEVENAIKSICEEAAAAPWCKVDREQPINGNNIRWNVIYGGGVYLLIAAPPGGDS